MTKVAVLLFAAALSAPAQAADRFDLLCSGTQRFIAPGMLDVLTETFRTHMRVDIPHMLYCEGDCGATFPIKSVVPSFITFVQTNQEENPTLPTEVETVNRMTGDFHYRKDGVRGPLDFLEWQGKCEPAAFSGFPTTAPAPTKF